MRRAAFLAALVFSAGAATAAQAPDNDALFREAVLGHCGKLAHKRAYVETAIDTKDWNPITAVATTGGQRLFNGKVDPRSGMIIDLAPGNTSCFVQATVSDGKAVVARLVAEIQAPGIGAQLLNRGGGDRPTDSGGVYGVVREGATAIPVFALYSYPDTPRVVTGVVGMAQRTN